jgi:hypothetical protein
MTDEEILQRIHTLVAEEHKLRDERVAQRLSQAEENEQVKRLEIALDQCWDLLRQRRARKEFGEDPSQAEVRPPGEVEGYIG